MRNHLLVLALAATFAGAIKIILEASGRFNVTIST
jgi:hypothetical protein